MNYKEAYEKAITSSKQLMDLCQEDGYVNVFIVHTHNGIDLTPVIKIMTGRVYTYSDEGDIQFRYVDMEKFVESRVDPRTRKLYSYRDYNGIRLLGKYLGIDTLMDDSEYPIDNSLMFLEEKDAKEYCSYLESSEYKQICIEAALQKSSVAFEEDLEKEREKRKRKEIEEEQARRLAIHKKAMEELDAVRQLYRIPDCFNTMGEEQEEEEEEENSVDCDPVIQLLYILGITAMFSTLLLVALDAISR